MQHRKSLEREAWFWVKLIFISERHKRTQGTTTSRSQQMVLISICHLRQPIDDDVFCSQTNFCLSRLFLFFQLEQAVAVADSYFLRMFSPLFRLFFTFSGDKLRLQFVGFVLTIGMSAYIPLLASQHRFKGASCTSQGCFWFTGLVPRASRHLYSAAALLL